MYTSTKSASVSCASNASGPTVSRTATATSVVTQVDADNKATALARAQAFEALQCYFADTSVPVTLYWNTAQTNSSDTFPPFNPQTFTVTIAANTVYSLVSVAEANATAFNAAREAAERQKSLEQRVLFHSTYQEYTARCAPPYSGISSFSSLSSGAYTSLVSQSDADAQALAQATAVALSGLSCTNLYRNAAQHYTASCAVDSSGVGNNVTVTNQEGTFVSAISQAAADTAALADATARAIAALQCGAGFYNVIQTFTASCSTRGLNWSGADYIATIPAGRYHAVTQAEADSFALGKAEEEAYSYLVCHWDAPSGPEN